MQHFTQKGFTLVELLIVIAVLGVLAVGLILAINPGDKIKAANDSNVLTDISTLAKASSSYAISHNGNYPTTLAALTTSGELKALPTAPSGYTAYALTVSGANIYLTGELKSKKYSAAPRALYNTSNGKLCQTTATTTVCP